MESLETDPKPGNRWFGSPMKMASTPDDSQGAQPTQFSLCEYSIGDTLKRYRSRDNRGGRFSGKSKSKSRQDKHQQFDHDEAQEELSAQPAAVLPKPILGVKVMHSVEQPNKSTEALIQQRSYSNSDVDEELDKPWTITGVFTGAMIGFGMGLGLAMPFWYSLVGMEKSCNSAWKVRF